MDHFQNIKELHPIWPQLSDNCLNLQVQLTLESPPLGGNVCAEFHTCII
jgi:hypothetical protein